MSSSSLIAVVIPCYKEKSRILPVIQAIGEEVSFIYVVDDCCPEKTGEYVQQHCQDERVRVIFNQVNLGVGGATLAGYKAAFEDKADIIVKIDGDGQMDPRFLSHLVRPILAGKADYTKGNRFFNIEDVQNMPFIRVVGNAGLSFLTKLSSGYWHIFDPTNGYTAISAKVAALLPFDKISNGYFFESDMLFRLNCLGAVAQDVPLAARYGDEESSLSISHSFFLFLKNNIRNSFKRIFYNYFLRNFSVASLELVLGILLLLFGTTFGTIAWIDSAKSGVVSSSGTVILAALPVILGIQFLLAFLSYDMNLHPVEALHKSLE